MLKVILFDADGVLIHGETFKVKLELEYGITPDQTSEFFQDDFLQCLVGEEDLKKKLEPYLTKWGWKTGVDNFIREWFTYEHNLDEDLIRYIQDLRKTGIKCCVATNQESYRTEYMLSMMGFAYKFDAMYSSAHLGFKKPQKEFFASVHSMIGSSVPKEEILLWDDRQDNINGARAYGFRAELYTSFDEFKKAMNLYTTPSTE